MSLSGKKLVVVTDSRVWSPGEGRNYRFISLISALHRSGLQIDLVTSRNNLDRTDIERMQAAGIRRVITGAPAQKTRLGLELRAKLRRLSPGFVVAGMRKVHSLVRRPILPTRTRRISVKHLADLRSPLLPPLVANYVHKHNPHFVMVEYLMHSYSLDFLKAYPSHARPVTMIDTYDVTYQRISALVRQGVPPPFRLSEEEERVTLSSFDIIIAINDEDRQVFEAMLPGKSVVTCLPACTTEPLSSFPAHYKRLLYVGGNSAPNADGLRNFLLHAWPLVRATHSDAELRVVGNIFRSFDDETYPNVSFEGYVDDLRQAYAETNLVISPVEFGGGLKIKVLEALAHGRPVVAAKHSAVGFSGAENAGLVIAEDWDSFAEAVIGLLNNPDRARELEKRAASFIGRYHNEREVMRELLATMTAHVERKNDRDYY